VLKPCRVLVGQTIKQFHVGDHVSLLEFREFLCTVVVQLRRGSASSRPLRALAVLLRFHLGYGGGRIRRLHSIIFILLLVVVIVVIAEILMIRELTENRIKAHSISSSVKVSS
jgi:hypothetical protein